MDDFDFTDDEIREQLTNLGIYDVPDEKLKVFKRDLEVLVKSERSRESQDYTYESLVPEPDEADQTSDNEIQREPNNAVLSSQLNYPGLTTEGFHNNLGRPLTYPYQRLKPEERPYYATQKELEKEDENEEKQCHQSYEDDDPNAYPQFSEKIKEILKQNEKQRLMVQRYGIPSMEMAERNLDPCCLDTSVNSDRKYMRRRVARKVDGQTEICDELTESELGDLSTFEQRMRELDLENPPKQIIRPKSAPPSKPFKRPGVPDKPSKTPPLRLRRDFMTLPGYSSRYDDATAIIKQRHPVKLRKSTEHYSLYKFYSEMWKQQEKRKAENLKQIREEVKYATKERPIIVKKPHKVHERNKYRPPDGSHIALRWQIRNDLANHRVPAKEY